MDALRSEAVFWQWAWIAFAIASLFLLPSAGNSDAAALVPLLFLIAAKIAHLFALLAAAMKARGL